MHYRRLLFRVAVAAVVAAASGLAVQPVSAAAAVSAANTATVVRKPSAPNAAGYALAITVRFGVSAPSTQWRLEFDLPPTTIPNPFGGGFHSSSPGHWILDYRGALPQRAGATLTIMEGILGTADPANCLIDGNPCTYLVETDTQPPTSPTPVTATRFSGTSPWGPYAHIHVTWGASTDNYRLAGYEVTANGQVIHSSTNTTTRLLRLAYTTEQVTYSVRAFDSVGNFSAPATVVLPAL